MTFEDRLDRLFAVAEEGRDVVARILWGLFWCLMSPLLLTIFVLGVGPCALLGLAMRRWSRRGSSKG